LFHADVPGGFETEQTDNTLFQSCYFFGPDGEYLELTTQFKVRTSSTTSRTTVPAKTPAAGCPQSRPRRLACFLCPCAPATARCSDSWRPLF
jgi:hypothetical protein